MAEDTETDKQSQLVRLIRRIAREEVWQAIDDHLYDYEHKERPPKEEAIQGE